MGAPVSAPVLTPPISIHLCALTGPRTMREGPARSTRVSFDHLGLTPELLRAVADQGYTEPTPVQAASIPLVLAGRDLLAGAQTGRYFHPDHLGTPRLVTGAGAVLFQMAKPARAAEISSRSV